MGDNELNFDNIELWRKRYYPDEEVNISGDKILYLDDDLLVTSWVPIKPRDDMARGVSFWFLKKGWKISKLYDLEGKFIHYYCDICRYEVEPGKKYRMIDLLADVIVEQSMTYKVVDMEELVGMLEDHTLPPKEFMISIKNLTTLLEAINSGEFPFEVLKKYN